MTIKYVCHINVTKKTVRQIKRKNIDEMDQVRGKTSQHKVISHIY